MIFDGSFFAILWCPVISIYRRFSRRDVCVLCGNSLVIFFVTLNVQYRSHWLAFPSQDSTKTKKASGKKDSEDEFVPNASDGEDKADVDMESGKA